jgi:hypothetical protein
VSRTFRTASTIVGEEAAEVELDRSYLPQKIPHTTIRNPFANLAEHGHIFRSH